MKTMNLKNQFSIRFFFCMVFAVLFLSAYGNPKEPDFGLLQKKVIEQRLTFRKSRTDYSGQISEVKQKIADAKKEFKNDPESLKLLVENYNSLLKTYQIADETNKKIAMESDEQMRKAAFLAIHITYVALQDPAAKKDFMKMINDPEAFQEKGSQSAVIMKYPNYLKEANSKKYAEKANDIAKDLNLKFSFGNLIYDNISDLEKAYETVKKLY